jgi:hypothetical protein
VLALISRFGCVFLFSTSSNFISAGFEGYDRAGFQDETPSPAWLLWFHFAWQPRSHLTCRGCIQWNVLSSWACSASVCIRRL